MVGYNDQVTVKRPHVIDKQTTSHQTVIFAWKINPRVVDGLCVVGDTNNLSIDAVAGKEIACCEATDGAGFDGGDFHFVGQAGDFRERNVSSISKDALQYLEFAYKLLVVGRHRFLARKQRCGVNISSKFCIFFWFVLNVQTTLTVLAEDPSIELEYKPLAEKYLRLGIAQATKQREDFKPHLDQARKDFYEIQQTLFRIQTKSSSRAQEGYGEGLPAPVFMTEKGKKLIIFPSRESRAKVLSEKYKTFQKCVETYNSISGWTAPVLDMRTARQGDVGHLWKIIDESDEGQRQFDRSYNFFHEQKFPIPRIVNSPMRVEQVLSKNSVRGKIDEIDFFLIGIETRNMTDGSGLKTDGIILVEAPGQYTTILGAARTINSLRTIGDNVELYMGNYAKKNALSVEPFRDMRIWKDNKGETILEAAFKSNDSKNVRIEDSTGIVHEIALVKLSAADRKWVADISP